MMMMMMMMMMMVMVMVMMMMTMLNPTGNAQKYQRLERSDQQNCPLGQYFR